MAGRHVDTMIQCEWKRGAERMEAICIIEGGKSAEEKENEKAIESVSEWKRNVERWNN